MANETELKLKITTDAATTKASKARIEELLAALKIIEFRQRDGKISTEAYTKAVSGLTKEFNKLQVSIGQSARIQSALSLSQQRVAKDFKGVATSLDNMEKASQQSRTALLSVSQAIQDAPYGIRGMSNNIDFLAQQFIVLRTTAGSTMAALKLMFTSLGTASGVLIGFSAVSAIINYFYGGMTKGTKGVSDELKKIRDLDLELGYITHAKVVEQLSAEYLKLSKEIYGFGISLKQQTIPILKELTKELDLNYKVSFKPTQFTKAIADATKVATKVKVADGNILNEVELERFKIQTQGIDFEEEALKVKRLGKDLMVADYKLLIKTVDAQVLLQGNEVLKNKLLLIKFQYQEKINKLIEEGSSKTQKENKEAYEAFVSAEEFKNKDISLSTQQQIAQNALFIKKAKSLGLTEIETTLTQKNLELVKELTEEQIKANEKQYDGFKQKLDLQNADKVLSNKELISNYRLLLIEAQSLGLLKEEIDLRQKIAGLLNKEEIAADKVKDMFDTLGDAGEDAIRDMGRMVATDFYQAFERVFNGVNSLFEIMVANFIASLIQMEAAALAAELFGKVAGGGSILLTLAKAIFGFDKGGYINEPVVGMGRSGRMYSIAEKGSELIIPNNRLANNMNSSRGAGGGAMNVIVTGKLKGRDIYLSNKYQSSYETLVRYA